MFGTLRNPCIYNRVIFRTLASLEPEVSSKAFQICKMFFFYLGFLSRTFSNHRTAGEGRGHFFNSSPQLPPTSQTLRHQPGDCCRELTSAHSQQPDSNREPLVFECKSLTTKLRAYRVCNRQKVAPPQRDCNRQKVTTAALAILAPL